MGEAVEPVIPDEEVLPEIFHHPLHFAFGSCPARATGPWQEPGVEHHFSVVIFQYGGFLVINQHSFHTAAEVTEDRADDLGCKMFPLKVVMHHVDSQNDGGYENITNIAVY